MSSSKITSKNPKQKLRELQGEIGVTVVGGTVMYIKHVKKAVKDLESQHKIKLDLMNKIRMHVLFS